MNDAAQQIAGKFPTSLRTAVNEVIGLASAPVTGPTYLKSARSEEPLIDVFYSPDYVAASYAFDTTRKSAHIAEALAARHADRVRLVEPTPPYVAVAVRGIGELHAPEYVEAIRTGADESLAGSQGFGWDEGIWPMAVSSTAGVVGAAEAVRNGGVAGSLSSGLHHARPDTGAGFCTVNGLAIAAGHVVASGGRVAIVDFDAHCGGGTVACLEQLGLAERIAHVDLSTSGFDSYEPQHAHHHLVFAGDDDAEYLDSATSMLNRVPWSDVDLILYNAGMDPHPGISASALAMREKLVFASAAEASVGVAWVLAGGYTVGISMEELVDLHCLTAAAALGG